MDLDNYISKFFPGFSVPGWFFLSQLGCIQVCELTFCRIIFCELHHFSFKYCNFLCKTAYFAEKFCDSQKFLVFCRFWFFEKSVKQQNFLQIFSKIKTVSKVTWQTANLASQNHCNFCILPCFKNLLDRLNLTKCNNTFYGNVTFTAKFQLSRLKIDKFSFIFICF